jgi:hypothetical protein
MGARGDVKPETVSAGTYHGAVRPPCFQQYIDEFVCRFNRRFWEPKIPNCFLRLCVAYLPFTLRGTSPIRQLPPRMSAREAVIHSNRLIILATTSGHPK